MNLYLCICDKRTKKRVNLEPARGTVSEADADGVCDEDGGESDLKS